MPDAREIRDRISSLRQEAKALLEESRVDEAKEKLNEALQLSGNLDMTDVWNKRAKAWVFYEYIKLNATYNAREPFQNYMQQLLEMGFTEEENMLFDNTIWQIVKALYDTTKQQNLDLPYLENLISYCQQIPYARPSDQHSAVLKAVLRVQEKYPNFLSLIEWWNLNNLQSADYQKEVINEREIMPLAERVYIAIAKKLLLGKPDSESPDTFNPPRIIDTEAIENFLLKLDTLIDNHPEYLYPPYFKAKLMLQIGERADVLKSFLPFAKKKSKEFWMWQVLAETFADDTAKQIACYCKALTCRSPEGFLIKIREELAKLLINQMLYDEAKTEIQNIVQTREKEGWRIPSNVNNWQQEPWFSEATAKQNNKDFYKSHLPAAEEILYSDIEPVIGVIDYVNTERGIAYFLVSKSVTGNFKFNSKDLSPSPGDFVELKLTKAKGNDGEYYRVLSFHPTDKPPSQDTLAEFEGRLNVITDKKGNNFGFVNDIFVSPDLLKERELTDAVSVTVKGTAIISFNKKKGIWGWKAISLK